ncbi:hypothetical protein P692DRAFT_20824549 [Suillus brevipes Sb2]|jgi:hypothetical protein|nr:hypothetical protein P692DRAFT_20824549 [Suillus brevipes Sb2]
MNDVRGGLRRPVLAVLGFVGLLGLSSALSVTNRDHYRQLELPVGYHRCAVRQIGT